MALIISSINSGSNGNCYYVGNDREAVLVDAGISCRETEKRMRNLGLSLSHVKAIFISHEHGDHIRGVENISKKYALPVYITPDTLKHSRLRLQHHLVRTFSAAEPIAVGDLVVTAFTKLHDASDPHSFTIHGNGARVGVFTDLGAACHNLVSHFKQCHAAFLEANYDEDMLETGRYPWHLKNRIRGGHGHLSNRQALDLFLLHRPPFMTHLLLSHLSKDNNCPKLVQELFGAYAGDAHVAVASRYQASPVYQVRALPSQPPAASAKPLTRQKAVQASLF